MAGTLLAAVATHLAEAAEDRLAEGAVLLEAGAVEDLSAAAAEVPSVAAVLHVVPLRAVSEGLAPWAIRE